MHFFRSTESKLRARLIGALAVGLGIGPLPSAEPTNAIAPATPAVTNTVTNTVTSPATNSVKQAEAVRPAVLGRDFNAYQLVAQRNIFNPNRTRRSGRSGGDAEKPAPRIEVIALSGTMSYPRGTFAFFDSSSSEFKKALQSGGMIAGYTVKEIKQDHVTLEKESAALELKVGQQLKREAEGAWEVTSGSSFTSSPSNGSSGGTTSSSSGSGEGPSEVLKRLLEQRKKENNP